MGYTLWVSDEEEDEDPQFNSSSSSIFRVIIGDGVELAWEWRVRLDCGNGLRDRLAGFGLIRWDLNKVAVWMSWAVGK